MKIERRSFLRLGAAVVGALTVARYAEPMTLLDTQGDWITDKGDYCVIRVPEGKVFAGETIHKPCIALLGERAIFRNVAVYGFLNIDAKPGSMITKSFFDGRRMTGETVRPLMIVRGNGWSVTDSQFYPGVGNDFAVSVPGDDRDALLDRIFVHMVIPSEKR